MASKDKGRHPAVPTDRRRRPWSARRGPANLQSLSSLCRRFWPDLDIRPKGQNRPVAALFFHRPLVAHTRLCVSPTSWLIAYAWQGETKLLNSKDALYVDLKLLPTF